MKKLLSALTAAVLPAIALVGFASAPAHAVAAPFDCSPDLYQVSASTNGLYIFDTTAQSFTRRGSGTTSGINAIGFNTADNLIYGIANSNLVQIDSTGAFTSLGSITVPQGVTLGTSGGDFLPYSGSGDAYLLTASAGNWTKVDVNTKVATDYAVTGTTWASLDLTINADGTKAYGINGGKLQVATLGANSATIADYTLNFPSSNSNSFGAAYSDASGDLFFFDNTLKTMFYLSAAEVAKVGTSTPTITTFGNSTNLTAPNDGASCGSASSPLAPIVTTSTPATSIADTSATVAGTVTTASGVSSTVAINGASICYSVSSAITAGLLSNSPNCATVNSSAISPSTSAAAVSRSLTGLTAGTTYYFQVQATNGVPLTGFGLVRTFTTTGGGAPTNYTVTWDAQGGSVSPASNTVADGSPVSLPTPNRSGYTFDGWFTQAAPNGTQQVGSYTVNGAGVTFYAHWTANPPAPTNYTITWDARGGSVSPAANTVASGTPVSLPTPSRSGYSFDGWFDAISGGNQQVGAITVNADVVLYAHWTANAPAPTTYNVYFTNLGGYISQAGGTSGTVITCPAAPVRAGYKFVSWGGACSAGGSYTITGNQTFDAKWETATVTVNFTNGGSNVNTQNVTPGSVVDCPAAPTRAGYTFMGWPGCVNGKYTVTGAANIEAQWDKTSYPITFTSNGEQVKTTSGTSGSVIDCPAAPTRAGFTFLGWPGCVDGKYTVTGGVTIAAQWIENLAPVPNPPAAGGGQTGHETEPTTLLPNTSKDGLKLTAPGWTLDLIGQDQGVNVPLDTLGRIVFQEGHMAHTSGSGFKPNSDVHVYIFSTPILLGILHTDANGNFVGDLALPADLNVGDHTVQVDGYAPDNSVRTADVPVVYAASKPATVTKSVFFAPDSTVLSKYTVKKITSLVKGLPMGSTVVTAKIVGFVYPINSAAANKKISNGRANNIAALLKKLGLTGNFTVIGAGRDKVADPTARRVDVAITYTTLVTAP